MGEVLKGDGDLIGDSIITAVSSLVFNMDLRIRASGTVETIGFGSLVVEAEVVLANNKFNCFLVDGSNFSMNLE